MASYPQGSYYLVTNALSLVTNLVVFGDEHVGFGDEPRSIW